MDIATSFWQRQINFLQPLQWYPRRSPVLLVQWRVYRWYSNIIYDCFARGKKVICGSFMMVVTYLQCFCLYQLFTTCSSLLLGILNMLFNSICSKNYIIVQNVWSLRVCVCVCVCARACVCVCQTHTRMHAHTQMCMCTCSPMHNMISHSPICSPCSMTSAMMSLIRLFKIRTSACSQEWVGLNNNQIGGIFSPQAVSSLLHVVVLM